MKKTATIRRALTWPEVSRLLAQEASQTWLPPKFPTRRWGNTYTLTSTTDRKTVEQLVIELKARGHQVKKKRDIEKTLLHRNLGTFYYIEIQEPLPLTD